MILHIAFANLRFLLDESLSFEGTIFGPIQPKSQKLNGTDHIVMKLFATVTSIS